MAAPPSVTTRKLDGKFVLNKTLSDDDAMNKTLALQGISWLVRKAIGLATVSLAITHAPNAAGAEHIHIAQAASGLTVSPEDRVLNDEWDDVDDRVFGKCRSQARRLAPGTDAIAEEYLKAGWTQDSLDDGLIWAYTESDTAKTGLKWKVLQIWGFQEVSGERRYVRKMSATSAKGDVITTRLVYDYHGPV